ncbi:site-specific integrase [Mucilaginibacter aquaedulcis]|uniref:site-specific integrase n=1 Tax=Mucilaginibacter aquaedulcis TaxID=1187081 RepID=UPI0025B5D1BF|nr:site-specific integrase [Mucilaginibacter aquaedulcis]MDN3550180.1 site-specific integrase [Mucilaginibacter aquaedulcis]
MIRTVCINFSLKKSKTLSNGTAPVYLRLTIAGERVEFTSRRYVKPDRWNPDTQKMTGTNEESRVFNQYLKTLEQKVFEEHRLMLDAKVPITAESLRDRLLGKTDTKRSKMLVPIFKEHNKRIKSLIGKEYASGTLERYETSLKHTIDFIAWQYKKNDVDICEIDHEFITSYDFYLRSERNCCNNTAVKYIKNFKKIIRICIANGWLDKDPFVNYKAKVREVVRHYLTSEEIQVLAEKQFVSDRVNQVRDVFLFSCFTGLAYADVKKLKRSEITRGVDKQQWIFTSRQKTDSPSRIPLLPVALQIIQKYEDNAECLFKDKVFPVLSNQKMNSYLKEIADVCGIVKQLTYHIARHTFATSVTLANGVSIESVSKMLGHKNIRTTQHYAKILDIKVSEDMAALKNKLTFVNL